MVTGSYDLQVYMSLEKQVYRTIPQAPVSTQIVAIPPSQVECTIAES
jgi:hypothetical protein